MDKMTMDQQISPERRPLTERQTQRLAVLSNVHAREIAGASIADISEKFRWQIDPQLLFFRRICGRVVKKDPITGIEYPVPFATVHVEDTDCSFLGFFPVDSPWTWFFPLFCRREEIATVRTDACGNFCVLIPRFDVDWILRWRHERICFPEIFLRPTIRDILEELRHARQKPVGPPHPEPDPAPFLLQNGGMAFRRAQEIIGPETARQLTALQSSTTFGMQSSIQEKLLDMNAFHHPLPPPLPAELRGFRPQQDKPKEQPRTKGKSIDTRVQEEIVKPIAELATRFSIDPKLLQQFDPHRFIGPFKRCYNIFIPQWTPILDVPDITFRVTQDVNGDGTEETIYSEGFFDVRWNAGSIPNVALYASQIAIAGVTCSNDNDIPCETPAIVLAGKMPVQNLPAPADPYLEAGYARRTNRPHPTGQISEPPPHPLAASPLAGSFPLYGCNSYKGAQFYRLLYSFRAPGAASFSPVVPFTGLSWPLFRWVGSPGHLEILTVAPDSAGWYSILNLADQWLPSHMLLNWTTGGFQQGLYRVHMQLGDATKANIYETPDVEIWLDNSAPTAQFTGLAWREKGTVTWQDLELICPVVQRIAGTAIELKVRYFASALHLRSLTLTGGGCGDGDLILTSAATTGQHWHTDPDDNSITNEAIFELPGSALPGAYSFNLAVHSRAFNPDDSNGLAADFNYDPIHIWTPANLPVAIVNA